MCHTQLRADSSFITSWRCMTEYSKESLRHRALVAKVMVEMSSWVSNGETPRSRYVMAVAVDFGMTCIPHKLLLICKIRHYAFDSSLEVQEHFVCVLIKDDIIGVRQVTLETDCEIV